MVATMLVIGSASALAQSPFIRGDVDGDGALTLGDLSLVGHAMLSRELPPCADAADVSDNGRVQLGDYAILLEYLIRGEPQPAAPFLAAGVDPTEDDLPCEERDPPPPPELGGVYRVTPTALGAGRVRLRVDLENAVPVRGGRLVLAFPAAWAVDGRVLEAEPGLELTLALAEDGIIASEVDADGIFRCVWLLTRGGETEVAAIPSGTSRHLLDVTLCTGSAPAGQYSMAPLTEMPGELLGEGGELLTAEPQVPVATIDTTEASSACPQPQSDQSRVRAYVWLGDASAEVGGTFRVSFHAFCNIASYKMGVLFDWNPSVLEVVGAENVRAESVIGGLLINYQSERSSSVFHHVTPRLDPIGGIRLCRPCGRFFPSPTGSLWFYEYLPTHEPREPNPVDEELYLADVIFRVLPEADVARTAIRLFEDPTTLTLGGADNYVDLYVPTGNVQTRLFARPLIDALVEISPRTPRTVFLRGDSNDDGTLGLSDAISTLLHLFSAEFPLNCRDAADANDDGRLDISDAVQTISYLFLGADAPPDPFPEPGDDPTADELACYE